MNEGTMESRGILRERLAMRFRYRGTSRLLHVSRVLRAREALELTDKQLLQLRDIRVELAQKLIKVTSDIRTVRFDTLNTVATKPVNFEQLRKNAKSISDLRLQRKTAVIDAFEKASNVLDDKQKHKLHEVIAESVDESWENGDETEADEAEE
jgi:sulfite reductase beta subunit-like hemoprotein